MEPAVHCYTRSTRHDARLSRQVVNTWYSVFSGASDAFAAKLRSEVDHGHYQSLDELFVHQQLRDGGWEDIRYEEGGEGPDYRLHTEDTYVGGVEVASLFGREDWSADQRRFARLADGLNERVVPTAGYFVGLQPEQLDREPSIRKLADFVRRKIEVLPDPDEVDLSSVAGNGIVEDCYEDEGVSITVLFLPMRPGARSRHDPDTQIVGMGPFSGGFVNSYLRLRDRIGDKASGRYELRDRPFLVAVGIHDSFCSDDQVIDALYGGEAVVFDADDPTVNEWTRRNDGLFGVDRERPQGRHRRVSAVATFSFVPWNVDTAAVHIYDNPFAEHPWPDHVLPARRYRATRSADRVVVDWED
jgi:hypothetical protein